MCVCGCTQIQALPPPLPITGLIRVEVTFELLQNWLASLPKDHCLQSSILRFLKFVKLQLSFVSEPFALVKAKPFLACLNS